LWSDVTTISETSQGFVIDFSLGKTMTGKAIASKSYISKSCLSAGAQSFLLKQNSNS
jgi:hypothetical protein